MLQCIFICDRCRQEEEIIPIESYHRALDELDLCHDCFNQWADIRQELYKHSALARDAFVDNEPQPETPTLWEVLE